MRGRATKEPPSPSQSGRFLFILINDRVNASFYPSFIVCLMFRVFRQLEAVVRIAESLAKMKLQAVAGEEEVDEALRLFQVSTLDAALSGSLSGGRWSCFWV